MNRRLFASGLLALLLTSTALPAFARDGDGGNSGKGGSDSDSGSGQGGSDDGGDHNSGGGDDGGGDDHGTGSSGPGQSGSGSSGSGSSDSGSSDSGSSGSGSGGSGNDHEDAKHAVDAKDALPLSQMLVLFKRYGDYTVIDVKLAKSNKSLLYVFKYIDTSGNVRKSWFDARSGVLVK